MPHVARYAITYGLSGCYLPDSHGGCFEAPTRRDLAGFIRAELEQYDMPASLFEDVKIRRLWGFISRHGSSSAGFELSHAGYSLSFHGLTQDEYRAAQED
jgi:hypothetical protein